VWITLRRAWGPPARPLLSSAEIAQVLAWLHHRRRRGANYVLNRTIFRLSCCCGLRCGEICRLNVGDIFTEGPPAALTVAMTPHYRARVVQLDWDEGTRSDLAVYKEQRCIRVEPAAYWQQPLLVGPTTGKRLTEDLVAKRWRSLMRVVLGAERVKQLSIQSGRRTYPSYAAAAGRTLAEITRALGNSRVETAALCLYASHKQAG
jgi:integrase